MDNRITNYEILEDFIAKSAYANQLPTLTKDNIAEVGNAIVEFQPTYNEFVDVLINRIGRTLVSSPEFYNRFAEFYSPTLEFGDTVQDIFIGIADNGENYSPTADPFATKKPNVDVIYHQVDRRLKYKVTIWEDTLKMAFVNESGLIDMIQEIINSLKTRKELDSYAGIVKLLSSQSIYGKIVEIPITDEDNQEIAIDQFYKDVLSNVKYYSSKLKYLQDWNALSIKEDKEIKNVMPLDNQLIIMDVDTRLGIDIEYLADIFNISKVDLDKRIIEIEKFDIDEENTVMPVCCIVDKTALKFVPKLETIKNIDNPEALYRNYILHNWEIISYSIFKNAVMIGYPLPDEA